jgi:hypothetical protein
LFTDQIDHRQKLADFERDTVNAVAEQLRILHVHLENQLARRLVNLVEFHPQQLRNFVEIKIQMIQLQILHNFLLLEIHDDHQRNPEIIVVFINQILLNVLENQIHRALVNVVQIHAALLDPHVEEVVEKQHLPRDQVHQKLVQALENLFIVKTLLFADGVDGNDRLLLNVLQSVFLAALDQLEHLLAQLLVLHQRELLRLLEQQLAQLVAVLRRRVQVNLLHQRHVLVDELREHRRRVFLEEHDQVLQLQKHVLLNYLDVRARFVQHQKAVQNVAVDLRTNFS